MFCRILVAAPPFFSSTTLLMTYKKKQGSSNQYCPPVSNDYLLPPIELSNNSQLREGHGKKIIFRNTCLYLQLLMYVSMHLISTDLGEINITYTAIL